MSCFPEIPCMDSPAAPMPEGRRTCLLVLCLLGGWVVENVPSFFLCRSVVAGALRWRPRKSFAYLATSKSSRAPTPKVLPGGFMLSCCCRCLPLRLDNPLAKSRSRNLVPRFRQSRYLALLIKTREQSVPRAENANRPALKGSPSNMAEMAVRRLEENAVRRNRLELVEPVVAVFCR